MLSCKDFVKRQNERIDGADASFMERMSLKMHAFICHHCRRYLAQLRLVDSLSHQIPDTQADDQVIQAHLDCIHEHNKKSLSDSAK